MTRLPRGALSPSFAPACERSVSEYKHRREEVQGERYVNVRGIDQIPRVMHWQSISIFSFNNKKKKKPERTSCHRVPETAVRVEENDYLFLPIECGYWPSSMRRQRWPRLVDDARVHRSMSNVCHRVNRLLSTPMLHLSPFPSPSLSTWTCHLISTICDLEAPASPTEPNCMLDECDERRRRARGRRHWLLLLRLKSFVFSNRRVVVLLVAVNDVESDVDSEYRYS